MTILYWVIGSLSVIALSSYLGALLFKLPIHLSKEKSVQLAVIRAEKRIRIIGSVIQLIVIGLLFFTKQLLYLPFVLLALAAVDAAIGMTIYLKDHSFERWKLYLFNASVTGVVAIGIGVLLLIV